MGQWFKIINIDKLQDLGMGGSKFGEFFFYSTPRELLPVLGLGIPPDPWSRRDSRPTLIGSWAGDRIICVGDNSKNTPDGMLTDAELQAFTRLTDEVMNQPPNSPYPDYVDQVNLYRVSEDHFNHCDVDNPDFPKLDNYVWVLRNLTKREYVRSDAIGLRGDFLGLRYNYRKMQRPGLGHAVVARIAWSSDPSVSLNYHDADNVASGVWAGDRFDIRTIDCLEGGDEDDGEWKDVSEELVEELYEIWDSEFGEDWEDDLSESG